MRKSKTLRDLQKQNLSTIAIGEEQPLKKNPPSKRRENFLDLSMIDRQKPVLTEKMGLNGGRKKIMDIRKKADGKEERYRFVEVDENKRELPGRLGEIMRMTAVGVLILFVINIVNIYQRGVGLKNDVIATAFNAYDNLVQAGNESKEAKFEEAQTSFSNATANFDGALAALKFLQTNSSAFFTREKTVESARNLLEAGRNIAEAGNDFARGIAHLQDLPALFLQTNLPDELKKTKAEPVDEENIRPEDSLTDKLEADLVFLKDATAKITAAKANLDRVSPDVLPEQMKAKLGTAREAVKNLQSILQTTEEKIPVVMKMLGQRYMHRYLILLQNDAEARPTGGFIGSYLIVDMNDGYVTKTEFHDIYETDGQLKEDIPAPEDIASITKNWRMRDSNYSPDFAISAEKAAWFLQKEKGPSVDSVIAVNQNFIARLFDLTGPVQLEGLQAPLTKENYQTVISYLVESKHGGEDDPKKILRSFIPAFQKQLMASKDMGKIIRLVVEGLKERDILLYSRDKDIQNLFDELGISGRVIRTRPNEDFLQVITTSIGGNKSDLYIRQAITHTTLIAKDGGIIDEVTITREHTWTADELESWEDMIGKFGYSEISKTVQFILGSGNNKSYVKVYVPKGSQLQNAAGIGLDAIATRTDEEIQKGYFMFQMDIPAGEEKSVTLRYKLPERLNIPTADTYRFFAQRQPGIVLSTLEKNIIVSPGLKIYESFPANLLPEHNKVSQKAELENDAYVAALVGVE
jgi:hypothetical protein